jgi:hypothetical protein
MDIFGIGKAFICILGMPWEKIAVLDARLRHLEVKIKQLCYLSHATHHLILVVLFYYNNSGKHCYTNMLLAGQTHLNFFIQ